MEQRIQNNIQQELFTNVLNYDMHFFEQYKTGELISLFNRNVKTVKKTASGKQISGPINNIITSFSHGYALYNMSPQIFFALILLTPLHMITDYYFFQFTSREDRKQLKKLSKRTNQNTEVFQGILTIKSFNCEQKEVEKYQNHLRKLAQQELDKHKRVMFQQSIQEVLKLIKIACVQYYSFSFFISNDNYTIGNFTTILRYTSSILAMYSSLKSLVTSVSMDKEGPEMEKIFEVLQYKPRIRNDTGIDVSDLSGDIEFLSVGFRYPKSEDVSVLKGLNFKINQGDYVAFVGTSGSGKSTIVKLIERFYDPYEGVVKMGGHHLQDLKTACFRRNICMVNQSPILFNTTIFQNIAYGLNTTPTIDQVLQVCQMSGCDQFISNKNMFPEGLQTIVGEKGFRLSGGQLQRIAIARALLLAPKISTSSLDAESEFMVQESIDKMIQSQTGVTIIVIAHRLSTIINCQKIFVLQDGQIAEQGDHKYLIDKKGVYADLVKRQLSNQEGISGLKSNFPKETTEVESEDEEY